MEEIKTRLEISELRNRIKGCYVGKNIGGTFGAPFECKRQVNEVTFYTQDLSMGPPANDDLDLQLVWLNAVEKFGRTVDSHILGEYWLSYIIPNWVEYGMAKANLRTSFLPPLSGYIDNTYGNSCGAFIEKDHRKLIDIGLSYIPENCAVSKAVGMAVACYDKKIPVSECRIRIHNAFPGTFGIQGIKLKEILCSYHLKNYTVCPGGYVKLYAYSSIWRSHCHSRIIQASGTL